ncbi:MAG: hypothetical protein H6624_03525 [Bdellovibrionaceae bacterium]|nr:hypothetical protein [Bdellovibrionales bacterium]MCB9083385.1 hypothetical protein [Pseudobdellovibrionaceae bacterium]
MASAVSLSFSASASKLDIMAGWFSISAKTNSGSSELSNFGAYRINYFIPVFRQLDLTVGYSLLMSDTFGGDLGYGVDGGVTYYPVSGSTPVKAAAENSRMVIDSLWRPYIGLGFSQRQFQSVQSTYAGFSMYGGVERSLMREFDFKAELRIVELQGAGIAKATEMTVVAGLIYPF